MNTKKRLILSFVFLFCSTGALPAAADYTVHRTSVASAPTELIGTYFYYDRRDHGYAFHLQLEAGGTAYYIERSDDANVVRKGSWSAAGKTVTVKLSGETKTLTKDDYGQLIERRADGEERFFSNIRRAEMP